MSRSFRVAAAALGLLLLAPAAASADSYLVTSCHDPLGQPNAADGWVAGSTEGGVTTNTCAANGTLSAALPSANPAGNSTAAWRFTAPPGTRIVRVLAKRATHGLGPSAAEKDSAYLMETHDQTLERCEPSRSSSCIADLTTPLDRQGLNGSYVEFRVLCTNAGRTCTRPLSVDATDIYVGLEDAQAPTVSNRRVIDDGDSSGRLTVSYDAADVGGGLYRALVKVDGTVTQTLPLAPGPCTDVNPGDPDPYQFNVPVPCPATVTGAQTKIDVRSLAPGPHGVEIAVEDAAGNQTVVYGPVDFPRPNVSITGSSVTPADALRGRLKMWFVKAKGNRRSYVSRRGTRVVTRGLLLTPGGRGIQGARIDVYHIRRDGKRRLLKTGLKSRAAGKLTLILPMNVDTRTIEFAFRAARPGPITSRQRLRLTVRTNTGRTYYRKSKAG
jgi:hypothetical protein